jgi:chondroitin 4-sulfotransferase 11
VKLLAGKIRKAAQTAEALLPEDIRARLVVARRVRHWREAGVIFIHVPKAAGTSVNETLYGRFMGHSSALQVKRFAPKTFAALPSFAIVRNPWERLVSAYQFARASVGEGSGLLAGIQNPEQYKIPAFAHFQTFVEEWLVGKEISTLDFVFRPQLPFVTDANGNVMVDHLGRLEHIFETESFLKQCLGRQIRFGHTNKSGEGRSYKSFYNPQLVKLVGRIYEEDVRELNYDFE